MDEDLSVGTPGDLHPTDEDLSVGTPGDLRHPAFVRRRRKNNRSSLSETIPKLSIVSGHDFRACGKRREFG